MKRENPTSITLEAKTRRTYNGHRNWNHWNVALWIANDEPLYREAVHTLRVSGSRKVAAERLLNILPPKTPDGAPYSFSSVFAALEGLS